MEKEMLYASPLVLQVVSFWKKALQQVVIWNISTI